MPIEFIQTQQPTGSSGGNLFRLTMAYDGSGRRISKTRWVKEAGSQDWEKELVTHYTGIGTEIRESFTGANADTKVVVNMPNGLGRYGIEDAVQSAEATASQKFEWYLKNHLGSTMLVYGTVASTDPTMVDVGETMAAYDYRAFGEMIELMPPSTDKVTENFTGKELDDEIALNYFGARYLDPMLGMWISVDPKRQFSSPYLYAGNGVNPVNAIDPDGNYTISKVNTGEYGFFYSGRMEYAVYGVYGFFVPLSGLYTSKVPEREIKNTLRPSLADGVISSAADIVAFGIKRGMKVASWAEAAFAASKIIKKGDDLLKIVEANPKFEWYMSDLTDSFNPLFSSNIDDLTRKVEWATSYGLDLYNRNIEINDEVKAQFYSDFRAEFVKDEE